MGSPLANSLRASPAAFFRTRSVTNLGSVVRVLQESAPAVRIQTAARAATFGNRLDDPGERTDSIHRIWLLRLRDIVVADRPKKLSRLRKSPSRTSNSWRQPPSRR